jgi:2,3-bisphosphoglycerate-dependent phosphoglycerate mutase
MVRIAIIGRKFNALNEKGYWIGPGSRVGLRRALVGRKTETMHNEIAITFMRHGRSRADDEEVHEGRYDSPLTETGRAQAELRAQDFLERGVHFDRIVASTLQRAHETARIIGLRLNVEVETDPDWMEIDNGPLAGLPLDVATQRFPRPAFRNPYEPMCGTGESDWEIYCRAARAVEKVVRRNLDSVLVVAHGGVLNAALRAVIGAQPPVNQSGIIFAFGDTGYARMVYYPGSHQWVLREFR